MNRRVRVAATVGILVLVLPLAIRAHTRGKPFTEEQLLGRSSAIFVGEVLEVTTFERYKRTVPSRVRVLISIKGKTPPGASEVVPKDPGNFVYFDEEFSQATKGGLGVLFVLQRAAGRGKKVNTESLVSAWMATRCVGMTSVADLFGDPGNGYFFPCETNIGV